MGGVQGHASIGFAYSVIGLWHLFNCIKLHTQHPKSYKTLPWFPISKRLRYLELIIIVFVSLIYITMEVVVGKQTLDHDGTIRAKYVFHFEHSTMALSFIVYAIFTILLDKAATRAQPGLMLFMQAIAFSQQLLILHVHSTDHAGIEGQYHWLQQIVTFVSLLTTILAIGYPKSFLNGFARAFSLIFLGVWLIVSGIMNWMPQFLPKGCYLTTVPGRNVVLCHDDHALERGKALANLQFGWYLTGLTIFAMTFYLMLIKLYPEEKVEYQPLRKHEKQEEEKQNVEAQTKANSTSQEFLFHSEN